MEKALLKENRIHGEPVYPVSTYRIDCEPDQPLLDLHWHDELEFLMVTKGTARLRVGASDFTVRAGEAIFVNVGELHSGSVVGERAVTFLAVVFHASLFGAGMHDKVYDRYILPLINQRYEVPSHISQQTEAERDMLRMLEQLLEESLFARPMHELTTKGLLHLCIAKLLSIRGGALREARNDPSAESMDRLKRVIEWIEERYGESITLGELAALARMSESYFCRFFKRITTKTPIEYINMYRIQRAAALLKDPNRKIMDIAMDAGFGNLNYFNTVFRKRFGCTPSEYRRRV
jgi:AraC-like DNA-binding protein